MAVLEGVGGFLFVLLGTLGGDYEDPGHLPLLGHRIFCSTLLLLTYISSMWICGLLQNSFLMIHGH